MFQQLVLLPSVDPSLLQSDMDDMGKRLQGMVNCVKNSSVWRFPAVYVYDCIWIYKHISTASFFWQRTSIYQSVRCGVYSWFYSSISTTMFLWLHSLGMAKHFPAMSTMAKFYESRTIPGFIEISIFYSILINLSSFHRWLHHVISQPKSLILLGFPHLGNRSWSIYIWTISWTSRCSWNCILL